MGTVHRLHAKPLTVVVHGREHVVGEDVQVARYPVQLLAGHVGREDDFVAVVDQRLPEEALDGVPNASAGGVPQDEARAHLLLDGEEVEAFSQHPVVALARLLEAVQVLAQVLRGEERGPVDPLQHPAPLVPAPVRAGRAQELEVPEASGAGYVRPAAEVEEGAVLVDGDDLVFGKLLEPFQLEGVVGEELPRLLVRNDAALEGVVGLHHLVHPLLNRFELFGREGLGHVEVVVEAVVDRGTEPDARARDHLANRSGQDVGGGMAQHAKRLRVALGEEAHGRAVGERPVQVDDFAVDDRRERSPRQAGSDLGPRGCPRWHRRGARPTCRRGGLRGCLERSWRES